MRPYRGLFSLGIAALLLSTLTFLFFPFIISMMADVAQGKPFVINQLGLDITFDHRNQLALLLLIIITLQAIFSFSRVYIFAVVNERVLADVRSDLFSKYISLPITY